MLTRLRAAATKGYSHPMYTTPLKRFEDRIPERPLSPPDEAPVPDGFFYCAGCYNHVPDHRRAWARGEEEFCDTCAQAKLGMRFCDACNILKFRDEDGAALSHCPVRWVCHACAEEEGCAMCTDCLEHYPVENLHLDSRGNRRCTLCNEEEIRRRGDLYVEGYRDGGRAWKANAESWRKAATEQQQEIHRMIRLERAQYGIITALTLLLLLTSGGRFLVWMGGLIGEVILR